MSKQPKQPKQPMPKGHQFRKNDPWTREQQRKGGRVTSAARRKYTAPFTGTMLDMMDLAQMTDPSWTPWRTFWRAILVQMLNPKAAVFFGSVFLTMLAPGAPAWLKGAALGLVFVIEFGWYLVVATMFSSKPARRVYGNAKAWVERIAGAWLALFGMKLALSDR